MRLAIILISVLFFSCSPKWHLRQAERHMRMAYAKGAAITPDTVVITKEVIVPEVHMDTVVREVNFTDTVVVVKNNIITKVKVNTVDREIYVKTICPPDTIKIEVPVSITKEIETGWPWWWLVVAGIVGVAMGMILLRMSSK